MTDNAEPSHSAGELRRESAEHRLPHDLEIATRRARERRPEADAITRCIRNAKRLSEMSAPHRTPARFIHRMTFLGSLTAAAAAVYLMITWNSQPAAPEPEQVPLVSLPVYSPITRISLVDVGYRRIEADLDLADAQLAQASEAIALAAVRVEVQQTLEEFYDWTDPVK